MSEVFVESVQKAAEAFGMTPAFVGFIVVALVGGAAEMASAFSGARKNRLDLSVGIALGSASQIALFVAPVLVLLSYVIGPTPMDLQFWPGAVVMMLIATLTAVARDQQRAIGVVRRRARADGLSDFRDDALPAAAPGAVMGKRRQDQAAARHVRCPDCSIRNSTTAPLLDGGEGPCIGRVKSGSSKVVRGVHDPRRFAPSPERGFNKQDGRSET